MANKYNSLASNWLSSDKWHVQVIGVLASSYKVLITLTIVLALFIIECYKTIPHTCGIILATFVLSIVIYVIRTLNPIYCISKKESRITICQITLLVSFGLWLIAVISCVDYEKFPNFTIALPVFSAVLSWIFQDTIKSVVAFFHLRANDLLHIDDWIEVKSHGIDGVVKKVSLTTVTIENWDTTTSAFPVNILHSSHFMNKQKMMDGKTNGRQMLKSFIIDTGWIHSVTEEELSKIKKIVEGLNGEKKDFFENFIATYNPEERMLNIELFRRYIYHWLMHHPHVSHEPRLIVRWLEQIPEGMPLQIYAFITDSSLAPFEWQQSLIIEHVIESMAWFNIQLYQSASGYDASNSNITIVEKEADYRRKFKENGEIL